MGKVQQVHPCRRPSQLAPLPSVQKKTWTKSTKRVSPRVQHASRSQGYDRRHVRPSPRATARYTGGLRSGVLGSALIRHVFLSVPVLALTLLCAVRPSSSRYASQKTDLINLITCRPGKADKSRHLCTSYLRGIHVLQDTACETLLLCLEPSVVCA